MPPLPPLYHTLKDDFTPVFEEEFAKEERKREREEFWNSKPRRVSSRVQKVQMMQHEREKDEAIKLAQAAEEAELRRLKQVKREQQREAKARQPVNPKF